MIYLDSNVFIFAALNNDKLGDICRKIIENAENIETYTCALTFDEVFWKIKKNKGKSSAVEASELFINSSIKFISVDYDVIKTSLELMKKYDIDPRDAIHAASAISKGIKIIVSEDSDFDKLEELKRKSIA